MEISVAGHKGRLGSELVKAGCTPFLADITNRDDIKAECDGVNPDVIINCAALTDVDACEGDEYYKKAFAVNTFGVNKLRDEFDGLLIHISTDYIFNGKRGPYSEVYYKYDPVNSYGLTKMAGEAVLSTHYKRNSVIVRTTGLYGGSSGKNDFFTLIKSSHNLGLEVPISKTLRGNQTYVPHLAEALIKLANMENHPKVINIASRDIKSRYEFALMIASVFGWDKELIKPVNTISGWVAKRPTRGGLKVKRAMEFELPIYTILKGLEALHETV